MEINHTNSPVITLENVGLITRTLSGRLVNCTFRKLPVCGNFFVDVKDLTSASWTCNQNGKHNDNEVDSMYDLDLTPILVLRKSIDLYELRKLNEQRSVESFGVAISGRPTLHWDSELGAALGRFHSSVHLDDEDIGLNAAHAADVLIYLDLYCARLGIDMNEAVRQKFNATSDKVNFKTRL